MADFEAWIADCHLKEFEGDGEYKCQAAVWADCYDTFRDTLVANLQERGLGIVWLEEVLPAWQYLAQRGAQHQKIDDLARAVHPGNLVEVGSTIELVLDGEQECKPCLIIKEIEGVEPLDTQFGTHPLKTVPDSLHEPLFGQPEPTEAEIEKYGGIKSVPPECVYAILDAGKVPHFINYIETLSCPHECLFQGDAAKEMRDIAPYIVELNPDENFTRTLFTKSEIPRDLWGKEIGIFIRSRRSLIELRKHFRKFTRVQIESDRRWIYFRFWEPSMIPYFLRGTDEDNLRAFFACDFELHTIDDAGKWQRFTLQSSRSGVSKKPLTIKEQDFKSFNLYVHMRYYHQLKKWVVGSFGNPSGIANTNQFLHSEIQHAINTFNTRDKRIIAHYVAASWLLGERAYESDKIDRRGIKPNSRGARILYERAFELKHTEALA